MHRIPKDGENLIGGPRRDTRTFLLPAITILGITGTQGGHPPFSCATRFRGVILGICPAERSEASGGRMPPMGILIRCPDPSLPLRMTE